MGPRAGVDVIEGQKDLLYVDASALLPPHTMHSLASASASIVTDRLIILVQDMD